MTTLTFVAILLVAVCAHVAGRSGANLPDRVTRALDSRATVAVVFVTTFVVLWYCWAAWSPFPVVHDEMAYVLQAQIFARGRWALPSPPFPLFWEQPHVLVEPTLTSKYFPGHSLALAIGALVGWPALMVLVLQSTIAALLYVLTRRLASGGVAVLAWIVWVTSPMTLYFGTTYFSETTSTVCWLAGWYALLEWRSTRTAHWLLAVAFFVGWDAITRPLTGVAYAIPIGVVVLRDVITQRRWRDLVLAFLLGTAVMSILPIWSANTTGSWRLTPQTLYTRMYMPYDVPGFGLDSTPPSHSVTPDLRQLNNVYSSAHVHHFPSTLPGTFVARVRYLSVSIWGATNGILAVFALLGLLTLSGPTAFAVASSVLLLVTYLLYATPPQWTLYFYESVPTFAYLSAAGMAWAAAMIGRPTTLARSPAFDWRSSRWAVALASGALVLTLPGIVGLKILRTQHITDRRALMRFYTLLESIGDRRAIVFVRYSGMHNPHVTFVRNVPNLAKERVWVVYDRGERENARLHSTAPDRKAYLFDEQEGRTYLYDPGALP